MPTAAAVYALEHPARTTNECSRPCVECSGGGGINDNRTKVCTSRTGGKLVGATIGTFEDAVTCAGVQRRGTRGVHCESNDAEVSGEPVVEGLPGNSAICTFEQAARRPGI